MSLLELISVNHAYDRHQIVKALSLELENGQICCLLGPSGCGKTTVLRLIAGFEIPSAGEIRLRGKTISSPHHQVPTELRQIGMVFQDYALFPHLNVTNNIAFGLPRISAQEKRLRIEELLEIVGLSGLERKFPHELSGGQQQRVALARALAPKPQLLLLDEPFSNLDVDLRERLSLEVRQILKATGTTAILVTHDQNEAFAVADIIGAMHDGKIEQWATPYDIYHRPASRFIADFIGHGVFVEGEVIDRNTVRMELGELQSHMPIRCAASCAECGRHCRLDVLLRPDDIVHEDTSPIQAEVVTKVFRGAHFLYTLRLPSGATVLSLVPSHHNHGIGERIGIRLDVDHVITFNQPLP